MNYRVLCDEHVPETTVQHLERTGIAAAHVTETPGAGIGDDVVANYALDNDYCLLTNDDDFLDQSEYPDLTVLYYPDNAAPGHALARRVEALVSLVPEPDRLGGVTFLTEE